VLVTLHKFLVLAGPYLFSLARPTAFMAI